MEPQIRESLCVLDSDDLVNKAYEGILGLMDIFPKHKRRLEKGTDIDISKYLRCITEFVMGDMPFYITSSKKRGCI